MQIPRIIFLNGPAKSGKDTLLQQLLDLDQSIGWERISEPVKDAYLSLFYNGFFGDYDASSQEFKDAPCPVNEALTNRDGLILLGKAIIRDFGSDTLGAICGLRCKSAFDDGIYDTIVIPDARIEDQSIALLRRAGVKPTESLLVNIYRNGTSFDHDLGAYYEGGAIPMLAIHNEEGAPEQMLTSLLEYLDTLPE